MAEEGLGEAGKGYESNVDTSLPRTDHYDDVIDSVVSLASRSGPVPAYLYRPADESRAPGIVLSAEAFGINKFTRRVAATLAHEGFAVIAPDYYRGNGPIDTDSYSDFTEVMEFIGRLDFTQATLDIMAGVDYLRQAPFVDPERVGVWGYCTGATLATLTACLDPKLAAAVLFFPSQPFFQSLDLTRPVHPFDMLWSARCPLLIIYGDQDPVMGPEGVSDLRHRLSHWGIDHQINIYEGAGHAFSAPVPPLRNDQADRASWPAAVAFARSRLGL